MQRRGRIVRGGCAAAVLGVVAGTAWAWPWEVCKIVPVDGVANDEFGRPIAVNGGVAVIGAAVGSSSHPGSVYVYDVSTLSFLRKIVPVDGRIDNRFGSSVGLADGTLIAGCYGDNINGFFSGSAYLFDVATGEQMMKFVPDDGAPTAYFGTSVAIDGGLALVGAFGDRTYGPFSGAAYIFDMASGEQLLKLYAPTPMEGTHFGQSVALSDGMAIVSAPFGQVGEVHVFNASTGAYVGALSAQGLTDAEFGTTVKAAAGLVVVSSYASLGGSDEYAGAAAVFDLATQQRLITLRPDDLAGGDYFGCSLSIEGSRVLVGAYGDDEFGINSGSAYLFDVTTGTQLAKLNGSDEASSHLFGQAVGLSGGLAMVGAPRDDEGGSHAGAVYVFQLDRGPCPPDLAEPFDTLDFGDVQTFLSAWTAHDPIADFAGPLGVFNFFDVQAFLRAFAAGCP